MKKLLITNDQEILHNDKFVSSAHGEIDQCVHVFKLKEAAYRIFVITEEGNLGWISKYKLDDV